VPEFPELGGPEFTEPTKTSVEHWRTRLVSAFRRYFLETRDHLQRACLHGGVTPATVSHHLKVLQEAGLIRTRRQGLFVYSSVQPGVVEAYTNSLARMVKRKSPTRSNRREESARDREK
jgi:DNA-binding transcriptional ArsR family regulator